MRRSRGDDGLTLIEVLVTVVILGIAFVTVVGGMAVSIAGSDMHRKQATSQTVLRNLAESLKAAPYQCSGDYTEALLVFTGTRLAQSPLTTPAVDGHAPFTSPESARVIDAPDTQDEWPDTQAASATVTNGAPTASIRLIFPPKAIPPATTIDSADLRIRHRQDGDVANLSVSVVVTPDGGPPSDPQPLTSNSLAPTEDEVDLRTLGLDTPAELEIGMTVDLTATLGPGGAPATEFLDGVDLAISPQSHPVTRPVSRPGPQAAAYTVDVTDVEQWTPPDPTTTTVSNGPVPIAFGSTPNCGSDTGLQRLTLQVSSVARPDLEPEELEVVKREF